jgi:hypothetical protein
MDISLHQSQSHMNLLDICNITHGILFLQAASYPQQYSDLIGCQV